MVSWLGGELVSESENELASWLVSQLVRYRVGLVSWLSCLGWKFVSWLGDRLISWLVDQLRS